MIGLEDSLREMFSARVESPPVCDDPAGRAIQRGRALRWRRTIASSVAATIAFALTLTGSAWLREWSQPESGGSSAGFAAGFDAAPETASATRGQPGGLLYNTRVGLDLRVGDRLWTADGRKLALDGVGEVRRVYRVPSGWVYGGASELRLLREDGSSIGLTGAGSSWVVSPDGDRLAVVAGTVLQVATIGTAGLTMVARASVPAGATPVAFFGERVAIAGPPGASRGFGYLDPGKPQKAVWNTEVATVYGPHGDGLAALVRRPGERGNCLAELEAGAGELRIRRTGACLSALGAGEPEDRLSPDGAWLVEPERDQLTLLDVDRALRGRAVTVVCPVRTTVAPAWADTGTVVATDQRGVVRCGTDGTQEVLPLPPGLGAGWRLVPKLMPVTPS